MHRKLIKLQEIVGYFYLKKTTNFFNRDQCQRKIVNNLRLCSGFTSSTAMLVLV